MKKVLTTVAMCTLVGLSLPLGVSAAETSTVSASIVVIEKVSDRRFRLVNNSTDTLAYMKWVNQADSPVAYCKAADGSVTVCSRERYLDSKGMPALQEARLEPGKAALFDAKKGKAVAVGVRLVINGEQRLLWSEL